MCYFVTLGIPARQEGAVEPLRRERRGVSVWPARNPHLAKLFPQGDLLFYVTHGGCSCDFYESGETAPDEETARQRERYRRKAWSGAKIARALEAKRTPQGSPAGEETRKKFHQLIAGLVEDLGAVRLFAHMYAGDVDTEELGACGRQAVSLEGFLGQGDAFPVDTLVDVVRGKS